MKTIVGIAKEGEESGVMCVNTLVWNDNDNSVKLLWIDSSKF